MLRHDGLYDTGVFRLMRYYEIAVLHEGVSLHRTPDTIRVDLSHLTPADHITNDDEWAAARAKGVYFYLSGGGSIVFNRRYLTVLRRPDRAIANPGKYSLFTGRAEGPEEWREPEGVVRELFEELRVFQNGVPIIPRYAPFQSIIDPIYAGAHGTSLTLTRLPLRNTRLEVDGKSMDCFAHVGESGDIHVLFAFAAEVDWHGLQLRDGEEHGGGRPVFLLDIQSQELQEIAGEGGLKRVGMCAQSQMTPHLSALLDAIRIL